MNENLTEIVKEFEALQCKIRKYQQEQDILKEYETATREFLDFVTKISEERKYLRKTILDSSYINYSEVEDLLGIYGSKDDLYFLQKDFEASFKEFKQKFFDKQVFSLHDCLMTMNVEEQSAFYEKLNEERPDLIEKMRESSFIFSDIPRLDDRDVQRVLREIDQYDLATALKNAPEEIIQKFLSNMSERAGKMLLEDMQIMGKVGEKHILESRDKVFSVITRLVNSDDFLLAD